MAGKKRTLTVEITGADKSAGKTFSGVADEADGLSGKLKTAGSKAATALKGALIAGGAVAGAAAAAAVSQAFENEVATDKLVAQLGLTGEDAEKAGRITGDLYADAFGDSMADVGDAVRVVQTHLGDLRDMSEADFKKITEEALTFSDVLDQDLTGAVTAASTMIRTGLAKDSTEAFDILTAGIQGGADKANDLLDTFNEYSTMFREIGLDGTEAMGLLVQGLQAGGRNADTVADALKEFAIRAQDGSETSAEGFELIGLSAEEMTRKVAEGGPAARDALAEVLTGLQNMEDPVARNAAAVALFGTKAEDLGDALYSLDLETAGTELGDLAGKTEGLGAAYDNASTKIESLKRRGLQVLTEFIGNEAIPALEDLWVWLEENVGPAAGRVARWVREDLWPAWQDLWRTIQADIIPIFEDLVETWNEDVQPAVDQLTELIDGLTGSTSEAGEKADGTGAVFKLLGILWEGTAGQLKILVWLLGVWGRAADGVITIARFLAGAFFVVWDAIEAIIGAIRRAIEWFGRLKERMNDVVPGSGSFLGAITTGGLGMAKKGFDAVFGAEGGIVTADGIQYLAGGGFAARGKDTVPAMLTPGEAVLTKADQVELLRAIRGGRLSGGEGGTVINLTVQGSVLSERDLIGAINRATSKGTKIAAAAVGA